MQNNELEKLVNDQLAELDRIRNYTGADEVVSLQSLKFQTSAEDFFKTKIPMLDSLTGGFTAGELIVVSGPTKNGKTQFCKTLTENFVAQGIPTLFFSYEMPLKQFAGTFTEIPNGVYVPKTLKNSTLLWIKSKILEAIIKYNTKIVFIDHLGFLNDLAQKQDRRIEIDTLIRDIKRMAIELEIIIFVVHHIRKIEAGQIPAFEDLKESSSVAQDSDTVLMIWREFERVKGQIEFTGLTKLSVEVARRAGVYKKSFTLLFKDNKFFEYEDHRSNYNKNLSDWENR